MQVHSFSLVTSRFLVIILNDFSIFTHFYSVPKLYSISSSPHIVLVRLSIIRHRYMICLQLRKLARPLKIVSPTINMFIQQLKGNYRGYLAVLGGFLIQLTAGTYHGTFGNLLPYFSSYVKKVNKSKREDIIFLVWKRL